MQASLAPASAGGRISVNFVLSQCQNFTELLEANIDALHAAVVCNFDLEEGRRKF